MNKENSPAQQILETLQKDLGLSNIIQFEKYLFEQAENEFLKLQQYNQKKSKHLIREFVENETVKINIEALLNKFRKDNISLKDFITINSSKDIQLITDMNDESIAFLNSILDFYTNSLITFRIIAGLINQKLESKDQDSFTIKIDSYKIESINRNRLSEKDFAISILEKLASTKTASVSNLFYEVFWNYLENPQKSTLFQWSKQKSRISINLLKKPYKDQTFVNELFEWAEEVGISCTNAKNKGFLLTELLLHPETRPLWDFEPIQPEKSLLFPGYHSDSIDNHTDQLNITPDVDALAALIAYEKLNPPLSIGLFGHWGSGKSFFMKLLSKKISEYEEEAKRSLFATDFCKEIVQIEFNAWHYSDANLWANFMVTIFEKLNEKIQSKNSRDEKAFLLEQFQLAGAEIALQNAQLKQITNEIESLNIQLGNLREENNKKASELAGLRPADIWNSLDPAQRKEIEDELAELAKELGLEKAQLAARSLNEFITEIRKTRGSIHYLFNRFVNSNLQQFIVWGLIIILPILLVMYLRFGDLTSNDFKHKLTGLKGYITTFSVICFGFVAWGTPKLRRLNQHIDKIEETRTKVDAIIEQKRRELASNEIKIQLELDQLKSEQQRIELQKTDAEKRKMEVELAIDNYNPRKQLIDFISNRGSSNYYNQHLGIISLIRNDLQKLSDLLSQNLSYIPDNKEQEKFAALPGIQRIVLYIDDLDRCPPDRVKQVLEAIHLLLSFKLFVVVVGVDARWVKYSLLNESSDMLRDEHNIKSERATAFDYIEKIFQIPFTLKPLNEESRKKLLSNYLHTEIHELQGIKNESKVNQAETESISNESPNYDSLKNIFTNIDLNSFDEISLTTLSQKPSLQDSAKVFDSIKSFEINKLRQQLIISPEEIEFISSISNLLGNTPRTIKRFVNIYRLIRVHSYVPEYSISTHADHVAIMLLLGVITGCNSHTFQIFQMIELSNKETLLEFASNVTIENTDPKQKELYRIIYHIAGIQERIEMSILRKYIPFISRFSFRSLTDV